MSGSGRMILEDGCLVEGRFRDGCLHGLARLGSPACSQSAYHQEAGCQEKAGLGGEVLGREAIWGLLVFCQWGRDGRRKGGL